MASTAGWESSISSNSATTLVTSGLKLSATPNVDPLLMWALWKRSVLMLVITSSFGLIFSPDFPVTWEVTVLSYGNVS